MVVERWGLFKKTTEHGFFLAWVQITVRPQPQVQYINWKKVAIFIDQHK